jgi:hypothetical protein
MSHTPGPWTIEYEDDDGNLLDDGVTIESCEGPVAFRVIDCSAPLISAAPELLAALRELVHYDEGSSEQGSYGYEVLSRCKAVIAKAEGSE